MSSGKRRPMKAAKGKIKYASRGRGIGPALTRPGRRIQACAAAIFCTAAILAAGLSGPAAAGELVYGGTFEGGSFDGAWTHSGASQNGGINDSWADHAVVTDLPFLGNYSALLGFKYTTPRKSRYGFMYQDVTVPADVSSARFYFTYRQQGYDGRGYDPFVVTIRDLSNNVLATVVNRAFNDGTSQFKDSGWISDDGDGTPGIDMSAYAGQTVRIFFSQENNTDSDLATWIFVDEVAFTYAKYVDLAVDGNGDDIFGDPGTGSGGSSSLSGEAGETVSYLLDIENEGLDIDSYTLSVSPPALWVVEMSYAGTEYTFPWTTPAVAPGTTITVRVNVTIPAGETPGSNATILDAVSTSFGNRFDSVTLGTNVVQAEFQPDMAVDSDGFGVIDPSGGGGGSSNRTTTPGNTVTYSLEVLNAGLSIDSFTIWFDQEAPLTSVIRDGAATYTGMFSTGAVDPGSSLAFDLEVTVPASVSGGDYETFVHVKSAADTLRKDSVTATTSVVAPKVDMIISGNGDDIIDLTASGLGGSSTLTGDAGTLVSFPVTIQNEGGVADSFRLTWVRPTGGWTAVINDGAVDHAFPWTTPAFDPYSERTYTLIVSAPGNASFDTYVSILNAVSQVDGAISESVTANITVAMENQTDLIIDGDGDDVYGAVGSGLGGSSLLSATSGDTVFFDIILQNESGGNTFDLQWNTPPGWEVLFNGLPSPITGIAAGNYILEVRIPRTAPGGTYDLILDAWKSNRPYYQDSVLGSLVVSSPYLVDALIDGNGDEIFGTTGAGDGGGSLQSTIPGTVLSYTVELQNQGETDESYTVDWNTVPGWTAIFDGQPAPYTTASIPAGGSASYTFEVTVPLAAAPGDYGYIIDVVSTIDTANVESVAATARILPPPRADLVIEGQGALVTAPAGSGGGGQAAVVGEPGTVVTAALEIHNIGGYPDSFQISWSEPAGWPAGSVVLTDGGLDYGSPFVTPVIPAGGSISYTLTVSIPAVAALSTDITVDAVSLTRLSEDSILLRALTAAFVAGMVFDDADHDGIPDPGEAGWPGVQVTFDDPVTPLVQATGPGGTFLFEVSAGAARNVIESTPGGMVSITPDTVSTGPLAVGDTVYIYFADVMISTIAPIVNANGPAGGYIDLPHALTAGTSGQASLNVTLPAGWTEEWYRDVNGDGILDPLDTVLTPADLALDPAVPGQDVVDIILRVGVPLSVPAGTVESATVVLQQTLGGTSIVTTSAVTDQLTVLAAASGLLNLVKAVDLAAAQPGDTVTYTIVFSNPGSTDDHEIEIIDFVSLDLELLLDTFGPGSDIEWIRGGSSVYLTADPLDADEALFDSGSGELRIILSRQAPFVLAPGEVGQIVYKARIR